MDKILNEFVEKNGKEIIQKELNENFILHLICLYDYQQIDKDVMAHVVKQFDNLKNSQEDY